MTPRGRLAAVTLGATTFVGVLGFSIAATPGEEVQAEAPAPASALTRVGQKNANANAVAAERIRREGPSAL